MEAIKKNYQLDFIGIGSSKSGSSWVSACLLEHPQINIPKEKSLFFFNTDYGNQYVKDNWSNWSKGFEWYLSRLPPVEKNKIRGEFGISYLHDPIAYKRIKKVFPNTKILVSLRNPVEMVYSLYWYNAATVEAKVPSTFEKAVEKGLFINRGKYFSHIKKFYSVFSKENVHIIIFDDIKEKPEKVVQNLYRFLNVNQEFKPGVLRKKVYSSIGNRSVLLKNICYTVFSWINKFKITWLRDFLLENPIFYRVYSAVNVKSKKYPPLDDETKNMLREYYKKDIEKLEKLIGIELCKWK